MRVDAATFTAKYWGKSPQETDSWCIVCREQAADACVSRRLVKKNFEPHRTTSDLPRYEPVADF